MVVQLVWRKTMKLKPTATLDEMLVKSKTATEAAPKAAVKPIIGKRPDKTVTPRVTNAVRFLHGGEYGAAPRKKYPTTCEDSSSDEASDHVPEVPKVPKVPEPPCVRKPLIVRFQEAREAVNKQSGIIDKIDKGLMTYFSSIPNGEQYYEKARMATKGPRAKIALMEERLQFCEDRMEYNNKLRMEIQLLEAKLKSLEEGERKYQDWLQRKRLAIVQDM